jgi:hypothetical protein
MTGIGFRHSRESGNPAPLPFVDARAGNARPVLSLSKGGNDDMWRASE